MLKSLLRYTASTTTRQLHSSLPAALLCAASHTDGPGTHTLPSYVPGQSKGSTSVGLALDPTYETQVFGGCTSRPRRTPSPLLAGVWTKQRVTNNEQAEQSDSGALCSQGSNRGEVQTWMSARKHSASSRWSLPRFMSRSSRSWASECGSTPCGHTRPQAARGTPAPSRGWQPGQGRNPSLAATAKRNRPVVVAWSRSR